MKPLFDSPTGGPTLGPVPGSEFHNVRPGHLHGGVDLNTSRRRPIISPRAGKIIRAALSSGLGGNVCCVDHGLIRLDGKRHETRHYHFGNKGERWQDCIVVRVGDRVKRGQTLGWAGDSGNATAVHDHHEHLVNGRPVDPLQYLKEYQVIPGKRLALAYPGSEGPDIPLLQQRLAAHGFNPGAADGIWGPKTSLAVKAFQAARGLTPDAILGRQTWTALLEEPR